MGVSKTSLSAKNVVNTLLRVRDLRQIRGLAFRDLRELSDLLALTKNSQAKLIAKLRAENEELETLNRSKDEFVAIASHQLRTPATAVRQYIGLLLDGYAEPLTPGQREFLDKAYESNERQLRIVEELLRVAQVDLDKLVLRKKATDLSRLVKNALTSIDSIFSEREQKVTFKTAGPIKVVVDPQQISLVLENLLENASNYTFDKGKIEVEVKADTKARIIISDNGVGINPKDYAKLFQKFSRVSNELSNSVNGTGLGLYFCKKIIELHDGTIRIAPRRRRGTSFIISLPLGMSAKLQAKNPT